MSLRRSSLVLALLAAAASPRDAQRTAAPSRTPDGEGVRVVSFDLADLGALAQAPPDELELEVDFEGEAFRLALARHSVRADDAVVRVWLADGGYEEVVPPPPATYRGTLAGEPGSVVLASLGPDGLSADVVRALGPDWTIRPPGSPDASQAPGGGRHVVERRESFEMPAPCGVVGGPTETGGIEEVVVAPAPSPGKRCLSLCEIAFEADYEYYQLKGSSIPAVVATIDAIMNQVDYFYARDVLITYRVTGYVVRTAPFYTPISGGDLLDQFRDEWNANQGAIQRDIAHLMTAKPGSVIQYGGLAWVGVVCQSPGYGYGWSLDSANIVGHEVGHNWNAGHCHDTSPCNNMCGACFTIAPKTKEIIEAFRDSRTCLDPAAPYATPLPPYAHPEGITLSKPALEGLGPVTFDVLANDHDGNCEPIYLASHDPTSAKGGRVTRTPNVGVRDPSKLVYTPPPDVFVGRDTFEYVVSDLHGAETTGTVTVDVRSLEPLAYWKFDDAAGQVAADSSGWGVDAVAQQPATWVTGRSGTAMRFNGVDQVLDTGAPDFDPPWTVSVWFKRLANSPPSAALIESSDGSLRTEQWWNTGLVGVTKYGVGDFTFDFATPLAAWVHLTFVGSAQRTTLYVDGVKDRGRPYGIRGPMGPISSTGSPLRGVIDELRVYSYAMSPSEVADLAVRGGKAVAPYPRDGGFLGQPDGTLSWNPGLQATSYDVYLGTDYFTVRDADTGSPEFVGNRTATTFTPGGIAPDTTYFWRVDAVTPGGVVTGNVWQFELVDFWRWELDETSGVIALEASGRRNGRYRNGPVLGRPGAAPSLGTSVAFDGSDDYVRLPALGLHSNEVTITAWLKRSGNQTNWSGVVFSRAGGTTAGLNFSTGQQLGYHWNDDPSTYNWTSGLVVPPNEWVFAALVVQPGRATLSLGVGGTLTSAVNTVAHSPEEFDGWTAIARDPAGALRCFEGEIDDVRIYPMALTPQDVAALYTSP